MSDEDEIKSQKPTPETAAVPLKKETIRVTLRANPDASSADMPSGGAPKPSVPKPTAPKPAAPAPTVPLGGAPKPAAPAPTVKLNTPSKPITPGGAPAAPAPAPAPTRPLTAPGGGGPSTAPLPKATVNLSTTQLPSAPMGETSTQHVEVSDNTEAVELDAPENMAIPMLLSIILFLVAALVFYLEYQSNQLVDQNFQVFGG